MRDFHRVAPFLFFAGLTLSIACSDTSGPGAATKLVFTTQPVTTTAGNQLPAITVEIQDDRGRTVTSANNDITLAVATNTATGDLIGKTTVAAVNGVATFSPLTINVAGINYALSATAPNLTTGTSNAFSILVGPAAKLGFVIQPQNTLANAVLPPIIVTVQDAVGNRIMTANNTISLAIAAGPGNGLTGTTTIPAVNGIATFSGLTITTPGLGYTLTATTSGLTPATSTPFDAPIGAAVRLTFTTQPATTLPGATIDPAVVLEVSDAAGNKVATWSNSVTVAIGAGPSGATLSGATTVTPVNGIATFADLSINKEGDDYTLTATSGNLLAISNKFGVRAPLVFTTVTAGYFHSCALVAGGAAYCWGVIEGQQGSQTSTPTIMSGSRTYTSIGAGRTHTCAAATGGAGYCWGLNGTGELGTGAGQTANPAAVGGNLSFASVVGGYAHSCGVTVGGDGYCWGDNSNGEVGDGTETTRSLPVPVTGGLKFVSISPGRYFTCGLTISGAAYCWGLNAAGELGDSTTATNNIPVAVRGGLSFAMVSAGGFHACGLTPAGLAYCWGTDDYGQLGDGGAGFKTGPVAVAGGHTFATISAGNRHTCAVTADGVAYCWGDNSSGNLGDGTGVPRSTPVAVAGGLTFANISAGRFHSCGVATNGRAYCWGVNGNGSLGDGTTTNRLEPVVVH